MTAKSRPAFLILFAFLSALTLPGVAFSQQTAEDFLIRGVGKEDEGDLAGAIVDCTKAIELNPNDADGYFSRGIAKKLTRDSAGANADFTQAAKHQGRG